MLTMTNKSLPQKYAPKNFMGSMRLFQKLSPSALAEVERKVVEKKFSKNQPIFQEGDAANTVWFVKEGFVKSVHHNASGRCQTLCMTSAQCMFGACCSFGQSEYPCTSQAETDVTALSLPMADFLALLSKYPEIGAALVKELSERLRGSKNKQTFDQEPVEVRIIHTLMDLVKQFGKTIPLTRREIAEMSGTTVETSIRTFLRFEKEGLVSTARGKISVKSIEAMQERLGME